MSEQTCSERVYSTGGSILGHLCGAPAKMQHEGRHYCGRHDPVKSAARQAAVDAKRRAEWAAEQRKRKLADAVRLAADAVVKAADAYFRKDMDEMWLEEHKCWLHDVQLVLARAVLAHRKAKAEQAKEAIRAT
jgi:hypothetical protein